MIVDSYLKYRNKEDQVKKIVRVFDFFDVEHDYFYHNQNWMCNSELLLNVV